MERFISLNLRDENDQSLTANPPKEQEQQTKPPDEVLKRLNQYANRAAHRAATQFGRGRGTGMFTK